jgi:hypothetical protein
MIKSGVIDAAIGGGVSRFVEVFLSEDYLKENPDHTHLTEKLSTAIRQQSEILADGLKLHKLESNLNNF